MGNICVACYPWSAFECGFSPYVEKDRGLWSLKSITLRWTFHVLVFSPIKKPSYPIINYKSKRHHQHPHHS